jgi:hypothetical protein
MDEAVIETSPKIRRCCRVLSDNRADLGLVFRQSRMAKRS